MPWLATETVPRPTVATLLAGIVPVNTSVPAE
jgi:hypothetical protein